MMLLIIAIKLFLYSHSISDVDTQNAIHANFFDLSLALLLSNKESHQHPFDTRHSTLDTRVKRGRKKM